MSLLPVILVTFFLVFCCAAGPIAPFASKRDLESLSPSPSLTTPYVHVASSSVDDDDDNEINALTVVPVTPSSLPQTASSSSTTIEPALSSSAAFIQESSIVAATTSSLSESSSAVTHSRTPAIKHRSRERSRNFIHTHFGDYNVHQPHDWSHRASPRSQY
ncbi:3-beta hydroxysteroid dehydrogenase/isomerase family protein [Aspergillus niger]|uniref:3-beta hydroxysteroid dehydrogenase/isomerase family protein n=1 Tax=Aspergillus niger TaxID=5061 RepID=A0A505HSM9_ASPNG|nr:3-beta hydroxysteroid dehydrogenase/isomerase family protein [Aspergillus niger]